MTEHNQSPSASRKRHSEQLEPKPREGIRPQFRRQRIQHRAGAFRAQPQGRIIERSTGRSFGSSDAGAEFPGALHDLLKRFPGAGQGKTHIVTGAGQGIDRPGTILRTGKVSQRLYRPYRGRPDGVLAHES